METYVILRRGGWRTADDLAAAAERSTAEGDADARRHRLDPQLRARGARRHGRHRLHLPGVEPRSDPRACLGRRPARRRDRRASPTRSLSGPTPHRWRHDRALQHTRHAHAARDEPDAEDAPRSGGRGWPGTARARCRDGTAGRRDRAQPRSDRERDRAVERGSPARRTRIEARPTHGGARARSRTRVPTTPGRPTTGLQSARGSEARCAVPRASAATGTRSRPYPRPRTARPSICFRGARRASSTR